MSFPNATATPTPNHAKQAKARYSEADVANEVGVSVDQLRTLVRRHIVKSDEEMNHLSMASFQPSDVLILKLLARDQIDPSASDSGALG